MDVVMPGLNGFQATRKITKSKKTNSIPVVIISSKNMESDKAWGLMQGAKDFLVKPIAKEKLFRMNMLAQSPFQWLQELSKCAKQRAKGLPHHDKVEPMWRGIAFKVSDNYLVASLNEIREIL